MKKTASLFLALFLLLSAAALPTSAEEAGWDFSEEYPDAAPTGVTINVYNWGEYIANGTEGSLDVNAESRGAPASRSTTRRSTAMNRSIQSSRAAARTTTSSSPPTTWSRR